MSTQEQREQLAGLLKRVASGGVSAEDALALRERWDEFPWEEDLIGDATHALYHFRDDADIRAKDDNYAESQMKGLYDWAAKLSDSSIPSRRTGESPTLLRCALVTGCIGAILTFGLVELFRVAPEFRGPILDLFKSLGFLSMAAAERVCHVLYPRGIAPSGLPACYDSVLVIATGAQCSALGVMFGWLLKLRDSKTSK